MESGTLARDSARSLLAPTERPAIRPRALGFVAKGSPRPAAAHDCSPSKAIVPLIRSALL
jgi:hypothetical protein